MNRIAKIVATGAVSTIIVAAAVWASPRLRAEPQRKAAPANATPATITQRLYPLDLAGAARSQDGCQRAEIADVGPNRQLLMAWFSDAAALQHWLRETLPARLRDVAVFNPQELLDAAAAAPRGEGPVLAALTVTSHTQPCFRFEYPKPPVLSFAAELYRPVAAGGQQAQASERPAAQGPAAQQPASL